MMLTDRGFSPEILQEFMIGFAPDERSFVSTPLINNAHFEISKRWAF
jgi:DNA primase